MLPFFLAAWQPGGDQTQHQPTPVPLYRQPAHLSSVARGREKEEGGAGAPEAGGGAGAPEAGGGEEEEGRGGAGAAASPGGEREERKAGGGGEEDEGGGRADVAEEERGGEEGGEEAAGSCRATAQRAGESLRAAAAVVSRDTAPPITLTLYSHIFLICPSC